MANRIWILGASDPEMTAIETLLRECGEAVVYATIGGRRVSAGEVYHADCTWSDPSPEDDPPDEIITVECVPTTRVTRRIDHHRPGDPGFGAPPEEFLRASSIGQVMAALATFGLLGTLRHDHHGAEIDQIIVPETGAPGFIRAVTVPSDLVLIAAADHCLAYAYAGRCPGVDPDALLRHRVAQRAAFQGRDASAILTDIEAARVALKERSSTDRIWLEPGECHDGECSCCDGPTVVDMRGRHVPELPDAGTRYGIPYIADGLPGPDGRVKIVCSGPADVIRAFFGWAQREGLTEAYGDPERGFAGAYRA